MRRPLALSIACLAFVHAVLAGLVLPGAAGAEPGPGPASRLAQAAGPGPARPLTLRGTVVALDGARLRVMTAAGEQDVTLIEPLTVIGAEAARLSDIGPGTFLGTAARTQGDGTFRALEVHIFPEAMRGAGEGHRPWEQPGTTMTNANVEAVVERADGAALTLRYQDGEVTVVVSPETPIVRFGPGDRGLIVPGASIAIFRAARGAEGTLSASRVTVGVRGARLPM
jgi:hypothetical protein